MKTRNRTTTLCLCLVAAALPASAAASEPVVVAPPAPAGVTAANVGTAGMNPHCRSRNGIEFSDGGFGSFSVRHFFRHSCDAPMQRTECVARLFEERSSGLRQISELREVGRKSCREGSNPKGPYQAGDRFVERYSYKLTLRPGRRWGKPQGSYCGRKNERRTLVCSDEFSTEAPIDKTKVH